METTLAANRATAEASGGRTVTVGFADDGDSSVTVSIPVDVAVLLAHRLGQVCKQVHGFRPAPSRDKLPS